MLNFHKKKYIIGSFYLSLHQNLENMTLKQLEDRLEAIQNDQQVTYASMEKAGLSYLTVKRIQAGENYQVKMLFKYVSLMCNLIIVNGQVIVDFEDLGKFLRSQREKKGITSTQMSSRMEVTNKTVVNIECGKGCKRENLLKYIAILGNIEFEIDEILNRI